MKFACKLIHGGPVHLCHRLLWLSVYAMSKREKFVPKKTPFFDLVTLVFDL